MKVLRFATQVGAWLLLLSALSELAVAVVVPRLGGATPYTVLTGSMRPHYPPGTLVVVRPVPEDRVAVGDVVTYQLESGKPTVVTHRVVAIGTRLDGERVLTTQGDANDVPDPQPVLPVQVRGELWYAVPYLGYLNDVLDGRQRQTAVMAVSALLVGYAAFMFAGALRDRTRRRRGPERPPEPEAVAVPEIAPIRTPEPVGAGEGRGIVAVTATIVALIAFTLLVVRRSGSRAPLT